MGRRNKPAERQAGPGARGEHETVCTEGTQTGFEAFQAAGLGLDRLRYLALRMEPAAEPRHRGPHGGDETGIADLRNLGQQQTGVFQPFHPQAVAATPDLGPVHVVGRHPDAHAANPILGGPAREMLDGGNPVRILAHRAQREGIDRLGVMPGQQRRQNPAAGPGGFAARLAAFQNGDVQASFEQGQRDAQPRNPRAHDERRAACARCDGGDYAGTTADHVPFANAFAGADRADRKSVV